jgi:deoxyribose-phosphate aldolase
MPTPQQVAGCIDHTVLKPEADASQVRQAVDEAIAHGFAAVCVNPAFIGETRGALGGSGARACTVVGFPLGANDVTIKRSEAIVAVKQGAEEIDFVAHLPPLLEGRVDALTAEFTDVTRAAKEVNPAVTVKVIIETALLMQTEDAGLAERRISAACEAARAAGCDFVKTSTGFHPAGGATVQAVGMMARHAGGLKVKAAGGIRTWDDAVNMLDAGADRLGCSAGVAILRGGEAAASY